MAAKTSEVTTRAETAVNEQQEGSISQRAVAAMSVGSLAIDAFANGSIIIDGIEIAVARSITRPVLRQEDNRQYAIRLDSDFYQAEDLNEKAERVAAQTGKKAKRVTDMEAARLCNVYNYLTKRDEQIIANAVFESSIREAFPGVTDGKPDYVGKSFVFMSVKPENKRYREYSIKEIHVRPVGGAKQDDKEIGA